MLLLCVLSLFFLMPAVAWFGKKPFRAAAALALWPAGLASYFASLFPVVFSSGPIEFLYPWAPHLGLSLSVFADGLSLLFATLISGIGALIVIFSARYFDGKPEAGRFQCILFAFMASMLGVVLSGNLFTLFVSWELTGFTSFLLIGFNYTKSESRASAIQALIVTGTGGMALLGAAILIEKITGTASIPALLAGESITGNPFYPAIVILILLAAFTKSAQFPFHFWLPNAMAAPTPVSAYLHSATMVKAGVYLVARMTPITGGTELWMWLVVGAGTVTMLVGSWNAVKETDLKRILAYSTISALGILMMLLGVGTQAAIMAALVYLVGHALYKGTLFLVAGTLESGTGSRDVSMLGGLRQAMPQTALAGALAACSMAGIPLFLGFLGKELLYDSLLGFTNEWATGLLILAVGVSALLGAVGLIAGVGPFIGPPGKASPYGRIPSGFIIPPLVLASLGFLIGIFPAIIHLPIELAVLGVFRSLPVSHLSLWHGFNLVLWLSVLTLFLTLAAFYFRGSLRKRLWPQTLTTDWLYQWSVQTLDQISERLLPILQFASLRAYVLALVMVATLLLVAAIVFSGIPEWPSVMNVQPQELAAVLMILGGAFSAVRAKSAITAVVSLGIVGYGVALTFLFFGAPDLAMTQFSVETLTAVIFVMVFYHFRGLGSLSPWKIRLRDATIAMLFGTSLALVLFFVGPFKTPLRIANFFAENGPALTHGRNIVNVILVDFRGLDTLGEITVLTTAALGVRAVLRMGREKKN